MAIKTIALLTAAVAFAGSGYVLAQQKPAAKSAAKTVVVYTSPT